MIVKQAVALHGPWPVGMTLFIFDDAYKWSATISRPSSEADNFYRTCALDLIARLATEYDLDVPRLSDDLSDLTFSNPTFYLRSPQTPGKSIPQDASKGGNQEGKKSKTDRTKIIAAVISRKAATSSSDRSLIDCVWRHPPLWPAAPT
jgi:hypothetical protein